MKNFQQNLQKLEAADTQVLGVSMDSPFANKAWAAQIGVTFPLLSDLGGDTSKEYGVYNSSYKAARRVTYLTDEVYLNNGTVGSSPRPVLRAIVDSFHQTEQMAQSDPEDYPIWGYASWN